MTLETLELDPSRLTKLSRTFLSQLAQRFPELANLARMDRRPEATECDLRVEVPSPSGDPERTLVIWMNQGDEPSVGFGPWHTHAGLELTPDGCDEMDAILDVVQSIVEDRVFLYQEAEGTKIGAVSLFDVDRPEWLVDELTSPNSSGRGKAKT